jgi:radical SAM enzyme (TIGR01210 family)
LEFITPDYIRDLEASNARVQIDILTGFETVDDRIRDEILYKKESIESFLRGLDKIALTSASLTAYVLYKPSPYMTDEDAKREAEKSIRFLQQACGERQIPLTIRLNPMYVAANTNWLKRALATRDYSPPRLSDVLALAERTRAQGGQVYIGLSTEGLEHPEGTYRSREDFSIELLKRAVDFNLR